MLFVSFDSATTFVRSTVATYVPTRHAKVNVAVAPGARRGTVNVPRSELPTDDPQDRHARRGVPAVPDDDRALVNENTYRSGRAGGGGGGATIDQPKVAGCPTLPAGSRPRTAKECVPTPSDWYEAGLAQPA